MLFRWKKKAIYKLPFVSFYEEWCIWKNCFRVWSFLFVIFVTQAWASPFMNLNVAIMFHRWGSRCGRAAFRCVGARSVTGAEQGMRTILPLCGGGGGGDDEEEHHSHHRSRAGWMKRLLWVRSSQCVAIHTDTEPGVWLRSFHSLDTDGQNEVRLLLNVLLSLRIYRAGFTSKHAARWGIKCFFCGMSHNFDKIFPKNGENNGNRWEFGKSDEKTQPALELCSSSRLHTRNIIQSLNEPQSIGLYTSELALWCLLSFLHNC